MPKEKIEPFDLEDLRYFRKTDKIMAEAVAAARRIIGGETTCECTAP